MGVAKKDQVDGGEAGAYGSLRGNAVDSAVEVRARYHSHLATVNISISIFSTLAPVLNLHQKTQTQMSKISLSFKNHTQTEECKVYLYEQGIEI